MHHCVSLGLDLKVRNVYYYISLREACVVRYWSPAFLIKSEELEVKSFRVRDR